MGIELMDSNGITITETSGMNFGKARSGFPVPMYFKVFNNGEKIAYNVTLKTKARNTDEEIGTEWKDFKLYDDSLPVKELVLGDISPNSYFEGEQDNIIEFIKDNGMFREVWNTGIVKWSNSSIKFEKSTGGASGIAGARLALDGLGLIKNVTVSFKMKMEWDSTVENFDTALINFPIRMNANNDLKGYCISLRRRRTDNKFYAAIYKGGKGMMDNQDRDYGINYYNTGWIDSYSEEKTITFKTYNNLQGKPCFEIYLDDQPLLMKKAGNNSIETTTVIDEEETNKYEKQGGLFLDYSIWNGDISLEIEDLKVTHEIQEHLIAIQTTVDYNAINDATYLSTLEVSYEEE